MRILFSFLLVFASFSALGQAQAQVDSLEALLTQHAEPDSTRLKLLLELTGQARFFDIDKADQYASQSEELSLMLNNRTQYGRALYYKGLIQYVRGYLSLGISYGEKAVDVFQEINDLARLAGAYELLGVIYTDRVEDEKAIFYLRKVLEIAEKQQDPYAQISSNSNIGDIYQRQGNNTLAKSYYEKAEKLLGQIDAPEEFAQVYLNLGTVSQDLQQKRAYYEKARLGFEKTGMLEGKAKVMTTLASDFIKQKNYKEGITAYNQAIAWYKELEFDNGLTETLILLAEAKIAKGDLKEAEAHLLEAVYISKEKGLNQRLMQAYESLATFYEQDGSSEQALKYFKLFTEIKEQNFNESKQKIIEENEIRYQTEKRELLLAEQALELNRQKSLRNQFVWGGVLLLLFGGAVAGYYYLRQQQKRFSAEKALQIKQIETENLREKERIKSAFFTNISHEFRTPLTLIITPLREMIAGTFSGNQTAYHKVMLRNAQRLLDLVNQLLDLAKLETGSLTLNKEEGDINSFIKSIASSFESLAEIRGIHFILTAPVGHIDAVFDKDKIQKIISNLLSNAFKFTPEGGEVRLEIGQEEMTLLLHVSDSGLGIAQEELRHIFDRFYQIKNGEQSGSGIGLALVKELVELHGGTIKVRSKPDEGTHFLIKLPEILIASATPVETITTEYHFASEESVIEREIAQPRNDKPIVLLAEDHPDVRRLFTEILSENYKVIMAGNGAEALEKSFSLIPDAIISDVMMPKMDGYEFCEIVKTDVRTSHIPVILLTALAEREDKLKGLETGADAYLTKPVDAEELRIRLHQLIEQRRKMRQSFSKAIYLRPYEIQLPSIEQKFISRVKEIIEEHLTDEQFGVELFAQEIGMSRSQLNRKLKAVFNQGPNELIRTYRLEKAFDLLTKQVITPTEASYQLGFSSPAYFSKCFSDQYGYPPSKVPRHTS